MVHKRQQSQLRNQAYDLLLLRTHSPSPNTPDLFPSSPTPTSVPIHALTLLETLDKTKITGLSQVDHLQDSANGLVSGQVGQGGLAQPLGDHLSKEGINRAERAGKDDKGRSVEAQGPLGG